MKTEATLLNGQRFVTDEHTRLHFHTGDLSPEVENLVVPEVGPNVHLRKYATKPPLTDEPTPYGAGRTERTAFLFNRTAFVRNYATTASSDNPIIPEELDGLTDQFRLSLFFRPDTNDTSTNKVLIAGMPGQFGLYQQDDALLLRMMPDGGPMYEDSLDYDLEPGAWHLLEVQWGYDVNGGVPMWYVNGAPYTSIGGAQTTALDDVGDRFNVATADKKEIGEMKNMYQVPTQILTNQANKSHELYMQDSSENKGLLSGIGLTQAKFEDVKNIADEMVQLEGAQEGAKADAEVEKIEATEATAAIIAWRSKKVIPRARIAFGDDKRLRHYRPGKMRSTRPATVVREGKLLVDAIRRFESEPLAMARGLTTALADEGAALIDRAET